jgi:outer membrane protein OmpA-like peptidoglycan-associated protein
LIAKGIDASRLIAVGYGKERPLVSNDDESDGREINRRTEFVILEK